MSILTNKLKRARVEFCGGVQISFLANFLSLRGIFYPQRFANSFKPSHFSATTNLSVYLRHDHKLHGESFADKIAGLKNLVSRKKKQIRFRYPRKQESWQLAETIE